VVDDQRMVAPTHQLLRKTISIVKIRTTENDTHPLVGAAVKVKIHPPCLLFQSSLNLLQIIADGIFRKERLRLLFVVVLCRRQEVHLELFAIEVEACLLLAVVVVDSERD
jgi:hypothetical protein